MLLGTPMLSAQGRFTLGKWDCSVFHHHATVKVVGVFTLTGP